MKNPFFFLLFFALSASAQQKMQVYFDFNKDVPTEKSSADLNEWISGNPDAVITKMMGFCDSVDTNNYNRDLAFRRMNNVLETVAGKGISFDVDMERVALGEDFEQSPDAAKNRRVDMFYEMKPKAVSPAVSVKPAEQPVLVADDAKIETKFANVKKGDIIVIKNINFFLNSEEIIPDSRPVLEELYQTMVNHPSLKIEIHGHICCNPNTSDTKLSYRRAKYIFTFLLEKGIPLNRLGYKGFGTSRPIYKIPEKTPWEEAANRRVEILVMDI